MTADFCCSKPAIRGWELNSWLHEFNKKQVRVIVILDTCYSGGAWRAGERFRSPENWVPPPNLPSDEDAVQGTQNKPGHRDGDLDVDWDINPKDFTLMTACRRTEKAAEKDKNGKTNGAFTLALKMCLQDMPNPSTATYHALRNRINSMLQEWDIWQQPQVFGRDRLAFLEDYEPFLATPIIGRLQEGKISLPIGKIHGIDKGTEFITTLKRPKVIASVSEIGDYTSKADVVNGSILDPKQSIEVIPFRWIVKETLEIVIDPRLKDEFREKLARDLKKRIAGDIRYPDELSPSSSNPNAVWFRLRLKASGHIDIFGPKQLLGYEGPVRGWKSNGRLDERKPRALAIALAHLFRFGQILHLRNESKNAKPFNVKFESESGGNQHTVQCTFHNKGAGELNFAVFILSPGFHVKQLFPARDELEAVPSHEYRSFGFRLTVPVELRRNEVPDQQRMYRDTIRTVVIRGESLSLKSMELPDIWNADQWDSRASKPGRNGELLNESSWWIQDDHKFTA